MKKPMKPARPAATAKRVTFQIAASPKSEVYLAGSFNQWDPKRHLMKDPSGTGKYAITLMLPKGQHEYKFVVNGNWVVDPECRNWVRNSLGTLNSVATVE
jgi:1,4-alpha-glucan branching enzyme